MSFEIGHDPGGMSDKMRPAWRMRSVRVGCCVMVILWVWVFDGSAEARAEPMVRKRFTLGLFGFHREGLLFHFATAAAVLVFDGIIDDVGPGQNPAKGSP